MHPIASLDVFRIIYYAGSPITEYMQSHMGRWKRSPFSITHSLLIIFVETRRSDARKQLLCNFQVLSGSEGCTSCCKDLVQDVNTIPNELSDIFPLEY
jgi:hypothetical protein